MNSSGDVAEQIVKISLEGVEVAAKITGSAAKTIAIMLYSILKNKNNTQTKGNARLTSMLKSGKELKVFTVSKEDLKQFTIEAKRYGVVYCALRGKGASNDGLVDIMVRAEDASKINRIVERFKLATVDVGSIKNDIEKSKEAQEVDILSTEQSVPEHSDEALLDELLGEEPQGEHSLNPYLALAEKSPLSEPILESAKVADKTFSVKPLEKPSVHEELKAIKTQQIKESDAAKLAEKAISNKPAPAKPAEHKQSKSIRTKKINKTKER